MQKSMMNSNLLVLVKMALVTALYVVVTLVLIPFSFGAVQFRASEMLNFLCLFNRRYIWSITLGVVISNLMSPFGLIDVLVGGSATLIFLWIAYLITKHLDSFKIKLLITTILMTFSMFAIAGELKIVFNSPFWFNYLTLAMGELLSLSIGAVLIYWIDRRVNLKRLLD